MPILTLPTLLAATVTTLRGGLLVAALAQAVVDVPAPARPASPAEGINKDFLSRDLDPEAWVARFEVESREVFAENYLLRFRRPTAPPRPPAP